MTLTYLPSRIACLQPSATAILAAVGELDRIVACTKYCADLVPEITAQTQTILHDSWTSDASEIIAARPDFVIASVPYQEKAVIEILKTGARFLGLAPKTLADIYGDIALIAAVTGASDRGSRVITSMQQGIERVRNEVLAKAAGSRRPLVFCEEWGKPLIASQPWVAELIDAAGGEFIGLPGKRVGLEEVAHRNPDVLIAAWCGAGDRVPLEKIIAERGWQGTRAAQTGQVYCVRDEYLNTPAPTLLLGLEALAFAIHPGLFPRTKGIRQITNVLTSTASNIHH